MNIKVPEQRAVIAYYGESTQSIIHMEECAELIQAVSKVRRNYRKGHDSKVEIANLVEEMADVLICMEQMQEMYGITDSDIQEDVDAKCKRQEERILNDV